MVEGRFVGLPSPSQDGASIVLSGFSTGPKPYEEVLTFLRKGTTLVKYGRVGVPKVHHFRLSTDDTELQWESKGRIRRISLSWIKRFARGQESPLFQKHKQPHMAAVSFSIYYLEEAKKDRTLDVICSNQYEFELWFWGLQIVMHYPPHQYFNNYMQTSKASALLSVGSDSMRSSVVDDHRPTQGTAKGSAAGGKGGGLQVSTHMAAVGSRYHGPIAGGPLAASGRRELGDLYVWGSLLLQDGDDPALKVTGNQQQHFSGRNVNPDPMVHWQQSALPVLVHNTSSMDVVRASCSSRHAALVTRAGEVYTWGWGKSGNLGQGVTSSGAYPQQVTRLRGKGIRAVSCSEGSTAAVSAGQRLYMWGANRAGQLGQGHTFAVTQPKLVLFPGMREDLRVLAVSCGPYHTGAIVDGGLLFTWGNGLYGKLGHGSHAPEVRPRRVTTLEEIWVTSISCGWWHMAAVGVPRQKLSAAGSHGSALPSPHQLLQCSSTPEPLLSHTAGSHSRMHTSAIHTSESAGAVVGGVQPSSSMARNSEVARSVSSDLPVPAGGSGGSAMLASTGCLYPYNYPSGVAGLRGDGSCSTSFIDLQPSHHDPGVDAAVLGGGGQLYTWGGDFSLSGKAWDAASGPLKRDHHQGALGSGDKEGRLLPTLVRGDLEGRRVVQVACGSSMTVVLTREGRVFQMGATGATSSEEKACAWEGCLTPTQVEGNLFGMFVEEVACGMHHVAVVASRMQANGALPEDMRRIQVVTWGRGAAGQLGVDNGRKDCNLPQVVSAIDGRRVLHIACGGYHTLAVCEHDPRERRGYAMAGNAALTSPGASHSTIASLPHFSQPSRQYMTQVSSGMVYHNGSYAASSHSGATASVSQLPISPSSGLSAVPVQLLHQLVAAGVGAASAVTAVATVGSTSGTTHRVRVTTPTERSAQVSRQSSRRSGMHNSGKLVGMPKVAQPAMRSEHNLEVRARPGRGVPHHLNKSISVGAMVKAATAPAASISSSGLHSHRSSPTNHKDEEGDSRSMSRASSLSGLEGSAGDFQMRMSRPGAEPAPAPARMAYMEAQDSTDMGSTQDNATSSADHAPIPEAHPHGRPPVHGHVHGPSSHPLTHPRVAVLTHGHGHGPMGLAGPSSAHSSDTSVNSNFTTSTAPPSGMVLQQGGEMEEGDDSGRPESTGSTPELLASPEGAMPSSTPARMPGPSGGGAYGGGPLYAGQGHPVPPLFKPQTQPHRASPLVLDNGESSRAIARPREISMGMGQWAQQYGQGPLLLPTSPSGGSTNMLLRGEVSFRTFPVDSVGAAGVPEAGGGAVPAAAHARGSVTTVSSSGRVTPVRGSSRGHSRHASHESMDLGRHLPHHAVPSAGASSGVPTPPRLTSPHQEPSSRELGAAIAELHAHSRISANALDAALAMGLQQQNDLLKQQVEALQQQLALLARSAGAAANSVGPLGPLMGGAPSVPSAVSPGAMAVVGPPVHSAPSYNLPAQILPTPPSIALHKALQSLPGSGAASGTYVMQPAPQQQPQLQHQTSQQQQQQQQQHSERVPQHKRQESADSGGSPPNELASPAPQPNPNSYMGSLTPPGRSSFTVRNTDVPPPGGRHRRSTSVDVSSLIAPRGGIGPAKDYLAQTPQLPQQGMRSVVAAATVPEDEVIEGGADNLGGQQGGYMVTLVTQGSLGLPPAAASMQGSFVSGPPVQAHSAGGSMISVQGAGGGFPHQQHLQHRQDLQAHPSLQPQHSVRAGGSPGGGPEASLQQASMVEYAPGVYLWLRPAPPQHPDARPELIKVRFKRGHYNDAAAQQWWYAHKERLHEQYRVNILPSSGGGSSSSSRPAQLPQAQQQQQHLQQASSAAAAYTLTSAFAAPGTAPTSAPPVVHQRGPSGDTQGTGSSVGAYVMLLPPPAHAHAQLLAPSASVESLSLQRARTPAGSHGSGIDAGVAGAGWAEHVYHVSVGGGSAGGAPGGGSLETSADGTGLPAHALAGGGSFVVHGSSSSGGGGGYRVQRQSSGRGHSHGVHHNHQRSVSGGAESARSGRS